MFSAQVRMRKLGELRTGASSEHAHLFLRHQYLIAKLKGKTLTRLETVELIVRTKNNRIEDFQQHT